MGLIHLTPIIYKYYLDNKVVFNTSVNLYLQKKERASLSCWQTNKVERVHQSSSITANRNCLDH